MKGYVRSHDVDACLHDIRDSAAAIERYTRDVTEAEFIRNEEKQDAVIRRFEIMGEAASRIMKIDPLYATNFPEIPLRQIYTMRNRITHGYDGINVIMILDTAIRKIPTLRMVLDRVITERENSRSPALTPGAGSRPAPGRYG